MRVIVHGLVTNPKAAMGFMGVILFAAAIIVLGLLYQRLDYERVLSGSRTATVLEVRQDIRDVADRQIIILKKIDELKLSVKKNEDRP